MKLIYVTFLMLILTGCGYMPNPYVTSTVGGTDQPIQSPIQSIPITSPDSPKAPSSPSSSNTPISCKPFLGTKWIAKSLVFGAGAAADGFTQTTPIVEQFNADNTFTENMSISGGSFSCTRTFSDANWQVLISGHLTSFSGVTNLENYVEDSTYQNNYFNGTLNWAATSGDCNVVVSTIQLLKLDCNSIQLLFRDGNSKLLETVTYTP